MARLDQLFQTQMRRRQLTFKKILSIRRYSNYFGFFIVAILFAVTIRGFQQSSIRKSAGDSVKSESFADSVDESAPEKFPREVAFSPTSTSFRGPLFSGLPLFSPWLSYHKKNEVVLTDPDGSPVPMDFLGRFFGEGDYVWLYKPTTPGHYSLYEGPRMVKKIPVNVNSMVCQKSPIEFETDLRCHSDDVLRVKKMTARWRPRAVAKDLYDNPFFYHFVIVNNTLYKKPGDGPYFNLIIEWLHFLLRKVKIPDVEFLMNPNDNGLGYLHEVNPPTLAFCNHEFDTDVLIPPAIVLEDWFFGSFIKSAASNISWSEKQNKCYYRGTNTGPRNRVNGKRVVTYGRFLAAEKALAFPDLFDVKVFVAFDDRLSKNEKPLLRAMNLTTDTFASQRERLRHRCSLSLDGNAMSSHLARKLVQGNVVIKQDSPWMEYYYHHLEDGENVVLVDHYFENLVEKAVQVLLSGDAKRIALNSFSLAMTRLREEDLLCWLMYVLVELSEKSERVFVREGMVAVEDSRQTFGECL